MKLRNKKTGEYGRLKCIRYNEKSWFEVDTKEHVYTYYSLAELNEEWEDYGESKECWYIDAYGRAREMISESEDFLELRKEIGNGFETREETKKAVEKLKAWERLKDNGFRFVNYYNDDEYCKYKPAEEYEGMYDDLELLFGGKE